MSVTLNPPNPAQASPTQVDPAQASPVQANTAQANTAQANTAQANTAQASPTQVDPAQANTAAEESFELVYRAIWQDNRTSLTESVRSAFMDWSEGLRTRLGDDVGQTHSKTLAGADASSIEVSLETTCDLGTTRTIMRVLSEGDFSWIWIDAESTVEHDRQDQALTETIQLVGSLVASSRQSQGKPHVGKVLLSRDATAINPDKPEEIENLAKERIFSPERTTPIVIFAHDPIDPIDGAKATMARADAAAQRLAGIAQVLVLPDGAIAPFQKMMGAELDVQPGEARVYMPYSSQTITHHPVLTAHQIRSNFTETCRRLLLMLKPTLVASEPPRAFDALQKTVETRKERYDSESSLEERIQLLENELEDIWDTLLKSRKERNNIQRLLNFERSKTGRLESELQSSIEDSLEKQVEISSLQDKLVVLLSKETGELPAIASAKDQAEATVTSTAEFTSVADVLEHGNKRLKYIVIHPEAGQELDKLDRSYRRDLWIRELMTGLKALGAYAHSAVEGSYSYKNFQDWCVRSDHPNAWPGSVKKLSMYESEEVKRRPELKKHRQMKVSTEVDPSGAIAMEAHLKLSNGDVAPRLYFYDDTKGETRMVHIGYFGPHLQTKRFPGS